MKNARPQPSRGPISGSKGAIRRVEPGSRSANRANASRLVFANSRSRFCCGNLYEFRDLAVGFPLKSGFPLYGKML
jgi:hypothetical protein